MASLERIYRLVVDAQQATRQLKKVNDQMTSFGAAARVAGNQLKTAFAGFVGGLSIQQFVSATRDAVAELDALAKTADNIGLTTSSLQELQYAAESSGLSADGLNDSMKEFAKSIGELRLETGPLYSALKDTDAALVQMLANTETQDEALAIFANKMQQAGDATERVRLANAAFGGGGIRMVNVLRDGAEGLDAFRDAARDAGQVIDENLIRKAEGLEQRWSTLSKRFKNEFSQGFVAIADAISRMNGVYNSETDIVNQLNSVMVELRKLQEDEKNKLYGWQSGRVKRIKQLKEEKTALEQMLVPYEKKRQADKEAKELAENPPDPAFALKGVGGIADYLANAMTVANAELKSFDEKMKSVGKNIAETSSQAKSAGDALKAEGAALTAATLTPHEELENSLERIQYLYEQGVISYTTLIRAQDEALEQHNATLDKVDKKIKDTKDAQQQFMDDIANGVIRWSQQSADAIVDFATTGKASFSDLANSIIADLARMAVQAKITKPLFDALGDVFGIKDTTTKTTEAHGDAFDQRGIIPFARGGVVRRPTIFPFASGIGLMGEAGPEAILPLSRMANGDLGVQSGGTTVNVVNNSGGEASVKETKTANGGTRIDVMIESAIDSAIARGRFDKTMQNVFGMRRRGA